MAINLDTQFFSHLNGINLNVAWGSLFQLYDKCLVNGHALPTVASVELSGGDVKLTFEKAHNALLFQIVELSGFTPSSVNTKYRIVGVLSATVLQLRTSVAIGSVTSNGSAKLTPLGYEIIYSSDLKRVYRAKNPTSKHPFIRMDETIVDGTNSYATAYAKSVMIGLIEDMTHIDDYENSNKLQLPLNTANFKENWQITGSGTTVVRGRCKQYWGMASNSYSGATETSANTVNSSVALEFTLCGDRDAVYICSPVTTESSVVTNKSMRGFGLFDSALDDSIIPTWFLMVPDRKGVPAATSKTLYDVGGMPITHSLAASKFLIPKYDILARISNSAVATPILPDYATGNSNIFANTVCAALQVPFYDDFAQLRGNLKHVCYSGNHRGLISTLPILSDKSMYVADKVFGGTGVSAANSGSIYFYLGELE